MGAYRGNADKVMKDAKKIARRLRETDATFTGLQKKYRCTHSTMMRAVLSQMSHKEWKNIRRKKLAQGGVETRFQKGQASWNKGLHYNPGGRSVGTRFQKSHLPHNGKKLGTITIRKDKSGQYRMIALPGPTAARHRWVYYAIYIWEQEHGPVPKGYLVVHEDGNRLNDDPNNLVLVDRRGNLALMKKNNPNVRKKAIRSLKKTCRIRRIKKAKTAKEAAKIREQELKRQQRAKAKAAKEAAKIREQELKLQQRAKAKAVKEAAKIRKHELKRPPKAKAEVAYELTLQRKVRQQAERDARAKAMVEDCIVVVRWECIGCGFGFTGEPPWKCPKCEGLRFSKITQRKYARAG